MRGPPVALHCVALHASRHISWVFSGTASGTAVNTPLRSPAALVTHQLPGVSHVKLPLKRCALQGGVATTLLSVTYTVQLSDQKTQEGCGCPKFLAGKGFPANFDAAGKFFTDFRQHEMLSLPKSGIFRQGKWLLENRPSFGNAPGFSPLRTPQPS